MARPGVLARDPDDGSLRWAYQFTPADNWDYDSTQEMILTELPVGGKRRKVLVHFDKNGFVYTLTSSVRLVHAPGNVLISARASGLPRDSVANVRRSYDRLWVLDRAGRAPAAPASRSGSGRHATGPRSLAVRRQPRTYIHPLAKPATDHGKPLRSLTPV